MLSMVWGSLNIKVLGWLSQGIFFALLMFALMALWFFEWAFAAALWGIFLLIDPCA